MCAIALMTVTMIHNLGRSALMTVEGFAISRERVCHCIDDSYKALQPWMLSIDDSYKDLQSLVNVYAIALMAVTRTCNLGCSALMTVTRICNLGFSVC